MENKKAVFEFIAWKWEMSLKINNCNSMEELKKVLSDELYGVEEYLEDNS